MNPIAANPKSNAPGTADIELGIATDVLQNASVMEPPKKPSPPKEPDHASSVFHVLLHLLSTVMAFSMYIFSKDTNYMDVSLFSDNETAECKMVYFTSIVMYKPATLSM